jgi:hypothetical protein
VTVLPAIFARVLLVRAVPLGRVGVAAAPDFGAGGVALDDAAGRDEPQVSDLVEQSPGAPQTPNCCASPPSTPSATRPPPATPTRRNAPGTKTRSTSTKSHSPQWQAHPQRPPCSRAPTASQRHDRADETRRNRATLSPAGPGWLQTALLISRAPGSRRTHAHALHLRPARTRPRNGHILRSTGATAGSR